MIEGWEKMSPDQRQDAFLAKWVSGEGIEFAGAEAKAAYRYRAGLIRDAVKLKKTPERVPIINLVTFAPCMLYGCSPKKAMNDPDALGKIFVDFAKDYDADAANNPALVMYGPPLEVLGYDLYKWPGHGIKDEQAYQFLEKPYMKAEDYDHFIADPSDYWLRVWMPRTHSGLKSLGALPPVYGTMELPMAGPWLATLGAPPVQEALKALTEAGRQCFEWINKLLPYIGAILGSGYPMYAGGFAKAPFDVLGDSFRGTAELMMDIYRRPQKVLDAMDRITPLMVDLGSSMAHANNNPFVFIPLHKGADGFMSNKQYEKFYWPSFRKLMDGLAERGCIPFCFAEGAYNERLEFLADMPKAESVFFFDRTDMAAARRVLGGKSCIGGGFPVSLVLTAGPQQVEEETKRLLDKAAGDGGYILTIGTALDEAREDTLKAFIEAGRKYGKY